MTIQTVDLAQWEPEYTINPYPQLTRLRTQGPIHRVNIDGLEAWLVTRHDDVLALLSDHRLSNNLMLSNEATQAVPWVNALITSGLSGQMLRADPPDHTRLRRLVSRAFTPRHIEGFRSRIHEIVKQLLIAIRQQDEADIMRDFADPLPLTVITELLGLQEGEKSDFIRWVRIFTGTNEGDSTLVPDALASIYDFLSDLIEHRKANSVDEQQGGSMLDALIAVRDEGDQLDATELVAMSFLLLAAGYDTTANLIGNGVLALLQHPSQLAALRADPALIGTTVDEVLRYDSPVKLTPAMRITTVDMNVSGVRLPPGQAVLGSLASANRDPGRYAEPDRFDIQRKRITHTGFGYGIHYCFGAPLAKLEAEIAIPALLDAYPGLSLADHRPESDWRKSRLVRGLRRLPVALR
jgi:cytochrome P450